jgi:hypothetical protein
MIIPFFRFIFLSFISVTSDYIFLCQLHYKLYFLNKKYIHQILCVIKNQKITDINSVSLTISKYVINKDLFTHTVSNVLYPN